MSCIGQDMGYLEAPERRNLFSSGNRNTQNVAFTVTLVLCAPALRLAFTLYDINKKLKSTLYYFYTYNAS